MQGSKTTVTTPITFDSCQFELFNLLARLYKHLTVKMASLNLSPDEMKALEATRNRLYQLTNSIGSLKNDLYQQGNPLPTP